MAKAVKEAGKRFLAGANVSEEAHRAVRMFAAYNGVPQEEVIDVALLELERAYKRGGEWPLPKSEDDEDAAPSRGRKKITPAE